MKAELFLPRLVMYLKTDEGLLAFRPLTAEELSPAKVTFAPFGKDAVKMLVSLEGQEAIFFAPHELPENAPKKWRKTFVDRTYRARHPKNPPPSELRYLQALQSPWGHWAVSSGPVFEGSDPALPEGFYWTEPIAVQRGNLRREAMRDWIETGKGDPPWER